MAEHVGRRLARRRKTEADPPVVVENPPPKLIPEKVHTSPFKEENPNPNSGQKLRDAPPGVPVQERIIHKMTAKYKSKTNEITNAKNNEINNLLNLTGDKRCASLTLQNKPRTRKIGREIVQLNGEAMELARQAQVLSAEVEELGEKAVKVPKFYFTVPVLTKSSHHPNK